MYECRVNTGFSAAHQIRIYDGELEPIHGHDWKVEAVFRGPKLDSIGILVDFVAVERALKEVAGELHHTSLNDVPLLKGLNPTAENVARVIFDQLQARLGELAKSLAAVNVQEAPGCVAGYSKDPAN